MRGVSNAEARVARRYCKFLEISGFGSRSAVTQVVVGRYLPSVWWGNRYRSIFLDISLVAGSICCRGLPVLRRVQSAQRDIEPSNSWKV